jgi:hypothetical protein
MNLRLIPVPQFSLRLLSAQMVCAGVLLVGCGGGGDAAPDSAGTGAAASSFASGPISGFGSIIVNGVRFDDSTATVIDDDGSPSSKDNLLLGMTAEVHGGAISDDGTGPRSKANEIVFGAALVGPVASINATARTFVMLGQTVQVLDTTVLDEHLIGGFAGISVGSLLEVHAQLDPASGVYTATRVGATAASGGFKIRGIVAGLDATAKTFTIGGTLISYAAVTPPPASLANGLLLSVRLQTAQVAGTWVATRLSGAPVRMEDNNDARVDGAVTAFTSATSFSVNGIAVDASHAEFQDGTAGIVLGAQVEIRGVSSNGVLIASRVSIETHEAVKLTGFELHGAVTALDSASQTFVLRGVTVSYASPTIEFKDGTAAQLAVGVQLEVKGTLSADGTQVQATRIEFGG